MSQLLLVRHAQARFLEDNYDRLSERGFAQARALGELWRSYGWEFDQIVSGPRQRQRETAETVANTLGISTSIAILDELDEYPADEILRQVLPDLQTQQSDVASFLAQLGSDNDRRVRGRALDRLLQRALRYWAESEPKLEGVEGYSEFAQRVASALARLVQTKRAGQRIVAFSSAGTIGEMLGQVLGTRTDRTLELGWMLNNSSVSELAFSEGRIGLARYNQLPHLPDPATWTHR